MDRDHDYNNVAKLQPGEYVHTHEENKPMNDLKVRTVGAIALCPSFNPSGDYYYQSLATGKRLRRAYCTPLPMPAKVITRWDDVLAAKCNDDIAFADRMRSHLRAPCRIFCTNQ